MLVGGEPIGKLLRRPMPHRALPSESTNRQRDGLISQYRLFTLPQTITSFFTCSAIFW